MKNSYRFFQNRACKYFPCHVQGDYSDFNCMFCYCPLYAFGEECGGNYSYTEEGIKDCSRCLINHAPNGYDYINAKLSEFADKTKLLNT